jgi:hypothetical protein
MESADGDSAVRAATWEAHWLSLYSSSSSCFSQEVFVQSVLRRIVKAKRVQAITCVPRACSATAGTRLRVEHLQAAWQLLPLFSMGLPTFLCVQ